MSGSILQSGPITFGHTAMWLANGTLMDAGPANNGALTQVGITNDGQQAFGINSGPVNVAYTGFGVTVSSTGLVTFSIGSFNGNPPAELVYVVNGITYPFPGTGLGNVLGPTSTTDGHAAIWNNGSGTLLADAGGPPIIGTGTSVVGHAAVFSNASASAIADGGGPPVVGPGSSVAGHLATFADASGKVLQDGGLIPAPPGANIPLVASVAALRALNAATAAAVVITEGYYTPGDRGGGTFIYVSSDTGSPDDGGAVVIDAVGHRYYRQFTNGFTANQYGAVPGGPDAAPAIQRLANWAFGQGQPATVEPAPGGYALGENLSGSGIWQLRNVFVNTAAYIDNGGVPAANFPDAPDYLVGAQNPFGYSFRNSNVTAYDIYGVAMANSQGFFDTLQGVAHLKSTATVYNNVTGIAGYVKNTAAQNTTRPDPGPNAVAIFGAGTAEVDGSATWGINTIVQDSGVHTPAPQGQRTLTGAEFDFSIMGSTGQTHLTGVFLAGANNQVPNFAFGLGIGALGAGVPWSSGVFSTDGATQNIIAAGLMNATPSPNAQSQPITLFCRDNNNNTQSISIRAQGAGNGADTTLNVISTGACNIQLSATSHFVVGTNFVVGPRRNGWGTPTGAIDRSSFDPATISLNNLAQRVAALLQDLLPGGHGLLGN